MSDTTTSSSQGYVTQVVVVQAATRVHRLPLLQRLLCRLFCVGDWRENPPDEPGSYWMQTKDGLFWSAPKRVEVVWWPPGTERRAVQIELLHTPKARRRWLPARVKS
jgi:hypothetical protein